jgi:hypothetical protein
LVISHSAKGGLRLPLLNGRFHQTNINSYIAPYFFSNNLAARKNSAHTVARMPLPAGTATLATFKEELSRLVAHFSSQQPYFTGPDYNEAKLREDFLNPFFAALGWDVGNRKGLIHTEREVDIEVRTEISGKQKRADYVFRIARLERLTCEAKKPAESLHEGHAYQAKRDAYARGIPFAVLSDFEDMRFYVVGARPHRSESVTVGQWKQLHFTQYADSAAELWDLLAYENVAAGSIDRLIDALPKRATRLKARQGYLIKPDRTRSLDAEFLNFLDDARQKLGSDLLKHNDREDILSGNRLNEAAQRILDRLVFLRICEDRGIDTGTLLSTQLRDWYHHQDARPRLKRGAFDARKTSLFPDTVEEEPPSPRYVPPAEGGLYRVFTAHVRALDQRPPSYQPFFNGQLFKPHFSEDLVVGDEWLANFIDDLTADDEGYNFADIKVEILGDAYERFLGKVLRPQGRGATIEEKPEVRKAGGVYYTPRYIVDYIVEQTVGRQLEAKAPAQVAKLRFLDPACGSGSFLIRVYERVMEHHLRHFTERVREFRARSELDGTPLEKLLRPYAEDYYLDAAGNVRLTTRLKRQILQNNVFGVDIDAQAVEVTQLSLYLKMLEGENRESLHHQAKDLFNKEALLPPLDQNIKCGNSLIGSDFSLDPAELVRVNAFDWDIGFEKIMNAGGFDAVVGNPPYGATFEDSAKDYIARKYKSYRYKYDSYIYFIEKAVLLARDGGWVAYITPDLWLKLESAEPLRKLLSASGDLGEVFLRGERVFDQVVVSTMTFAFCKGAKPKETKVKTENDAWSMNHNTWLSTPGLAIDYRLGPTVRKLVEKIAAGSVPLENFGQAIQGITPYDKYKGQSPELIKQRGYHFAHKSDSTCEKWLAGEDVKRFALSWGGEWLKYGPWLGAPRLPEFFTGPRLLFREIPGEGKRIIATFVPRETYYHGHSVTPFKPKSGVNPLYLLGLINSRLISWYGALMLPNLGKSTFPKLNPQDIRALPIVNAVAQDQQKQIAHLSERMLSLSAALAATGSEQERSALQNAIRKTDRDIDQLVYQLYGLTPEEIALVEGTAETADAVTEA